MATYYVYSGAAGSANGSSWANAFTNLTAAFTADVAGDTLYVAHDHAESTAAGVDLISSGTAAAPVKVICVNRAGSVPPVAADRRATASVAATGSNNIWISGYVHIDGVIFTAGTSSVAANLIIPAATLNWQRFDNCSLRIGTTNSTSIIMFGNPGTSRGCLVEMNNTTVSFANVGQSIQINAVVKWNNTPTALIGTAVPTLLFTQPVGHGGSVDCVGVDLSAAGSGKTLVDGVGQCVAQRYNFIDCKLHASVTKSVVPLGNGTTDIDFVRCGSSGVNYATFRHRKAGTLDHETTIIRTGGASDGTTPIAWKIVTTANCNYSMPFECPPIAIWNDTTGASVTATIEGIWGGGAVPLDDEIWLDVEYLGDASSPQGSFVNDGKANLLTTAANQTSSSETWGGSTTKFKLAVSFTPPQKGWIYARVKAGKLSSTFYIDPLITLT